MYCLMCQVTKTTEQSKPVLLHTQVDENVSDEWMVKKRRSEECVGIDDMNKQKKINCSLYVTAERPIYM